MNNNIIQFDYLPEEKTVKINLPEEVLDNINTIIITRRFKDEITVKRVKEVKPDSGGGSPED